VHSQKKVTLSTWPIHKVSEVTGLSSHCLRAWERRYGAIEVERTPGGQRLYSEQTIERLKILSKLSREGHSIRALAPLSSEDLAELLKAPSTPSEDPGLTRSEIGLRQITALIGDLRRFDFVGLHQLLLRERTQRSAKNFALEVVLPILRHVGDLVHQGDLGIAEEHALSAILRNHLGELQRALIASSRSTFRSVLFTTLEGDYHEFGILIGSILISETGRQVHYLGTSLPTDEILRACAKLQVDDLVLGMTEIPKSHRVVEPVRELGVLDASLPQRTRIWIGGRLPSLFKHHSTRLHEIGSLLELEKEFLSREEGE
jgi:DNA-binding transcriptional MerR regulator